MSHKFFRIQIVHQRKYECNMFSWNQYSIYYGYKNVSFWKFNLRFWVIFRSHRYQHKLKYLTKWKHSPPSYLQSYFCALFQSKVILNPRIRSSDCVLSPEIHGGVKVCPRTDRSQKCLRFAMNCPHGPCPSNTQCVSNLQYDSFLIKSFGTNN